MTYNQMKRSVAVTIATGLVAAAAAVRCFGQQVPEPTNTPSTNFLSGPAATAWDFLTATGTNWMVVPYGMVNSESHKIGGGVGLAYHVSDYVCPMLRIDYFDKQLTMPSGTVQLQLPMTFMGKFTLIPLAYAGIATPISGGTTLGGPGNGTPISIFGAGAAIRLGKNLDVVFDIEKRSSFAGEFFLLGLIYKF